MKFGYTGISHTIYSKFLCDVVGFRVLMVLQVQLELQDREALWVFLVREESVECQAFQDLQYVSFKS